MQQQQLQQQPKQLLPSQPDIQLEDRRLKTKPIEPKNYKKVKLRLDQDVSQVDNVNVNRGFVEETPIREENPIVKVPVSNDRPIPRENPIQERTIPIVQQIPEKPIAQYARDPAQSVTQYADAPSPIRQHASPASAYEEKSIPIIRQYAREPTQISPSQEQKAFPQYGKPQYAREPVTPPRMEERPVQVVTQYVRQIPIEREEMKPVATSTMHAKERFFSSPIQEQTPIIRQYAKEVPVQREAYQNPTPSAPPREHTIGRQYSREKQSPPQERTIPITQYAREVSPHSPTQTQYHQTSVKHNGENVTREFKEEKSGASLNMAWQVTSRYDQKEEKQYENIFRREFRTGPGGLHHESHGKQNGGEQPLESAV